MRLLEQTSAAITQPEPTQTDAQTTAEQYATFQSQVDAETQSLEQQLEELIQQNTPSLPQSITQVRHWVLISKL